MKKVNFTEMKNGTKEDYMFLDKLEKEYVGETADRILGFLSRMTSTLEGYKISRLEHSLQSATRAYKNKESEEMVVACLLHDIGEYAATVLKPYVSEKTHWIIEKHGEFQMYYYAHHLGADRFKREKYKDHKYYQATVDFCEKYDQCSFDPNYKSMSLKDFEPMVRNIFSRKPYSHY